MKTIIKIMLAILGGINITFSMLIPIFISFLIINNYPDLGSWNQTIIMIGGYASSFYRAVQVWIE